MNTPFTPSTALVLELHAAEGGVDSRRFVADLADGYLRLATRKG